MGDEFTLYEHGLSRLLKALNGESNQQLYRDVLLLQMELARNIERARRYGPSPEQEADLNRILEQLIDASLLATEKSFFEWCQIQKITVPRKQDNLSDLRQEGLSQKLLDAFIELGARPQAGQNLADEDLLERYATIPLHAVFLYTSEDKAIPDYILEHWGALDSLSGSICDIHPLLAQFQNAGQAYEYIDKLNIVKESTFNEFSQLPGLFFWDHVGNTEFVSFGIEAQPVQIKNVLRVVFEELRREPDLKAVKRAKRILSQTQHFGPQPSPLPDPIEQTDIAVIIALQEEFDIFFPTIARNHRAERDPESGISFFHFAAPAKAQHARPYRCVVGLLGRMGPTMAAIVTQRMIGLYQPQTIVMLGIAAGIHTDVRLGDVIVADSIDSYLDRGKLGKQEENHPFPLVLSGQVYQCSADLLHSLHTFKYHHAAAYKQWRLTSARFWRKYLKEATHSSLAQTGETPPPVTYTIGPLASGPLVIASTSFKELLLQRNRSFLGVEMEASGTLAASHQSLNSKKLLVLRGISDYGDERKAGLDQLQQGIVRRFAMYNTVQLFWKLLETGIFPQTDHPSR